MKKLSIVVPCYNVEKYIDRCVNSLVNQTLSHSEYEIILVDDASADDTWKHITDWEQRFPELIMAIVMRMERWVRQEILEFLMLRESI